MYGFESNTILEVLLFPLRTPLPTSHRPEKKFHAEIVSLPKIGHIWKCLFLKGSFSTQALLTFWA